MPKRNTNINVFGLKNDKYKYEYIKVDKERTNTNTNMNIWTGICNYKFKYKYSSHTVLPLTLQTHFTIKLWAYWHLLEASQGNGRMQKCQGETNQ